MDEVNSRNGRECCNFHWQQQIFDVPTNCVLGLSCWIRISFETDCSNIFQTSDGRALLWKAKYFSILCHFISVNKSLKLALCSHLLSRLTCSRPRPRRLKTSLETTRDQDSSVENHNCGYVCCLRYLLHCYTVAWFPVLKIQDAWEFCTHKFQDYSVPKWFSRTRKIRERFQVLSRMCGNLVVNQKVIFL